MSSASALLRRDRSDRWPFAAAALLAIVVHGAAALSASNAAPRAINQRVQMEIYRPPPPPPPPPAPPPEPEVPKPKPPPPKRETPPPPPPPNQEQAPPPPSAPVPIVTGISLSSTVASSSGVSVRVGNTTFGDPNKEKFTKPGDVKPYAEGSPDFKAERASSLSREATVARDFKARYPKELADQGVEGSVVLLIDIASNGKAVSATVARSSGNAQLDALALDAVKERFVWRPAERDGVRVDSRLRYTYRFELVE
ncbi:MAG: energy transducer TonB [Deltaproteobacteria bacterium]|nr:energy transducer TonB [Deltaproteobacteria bacterium]